MRRAKKYRTTKEERGEEEGPKGRTWWVVVCVKEDSYLKIVSLEFSREKHGMGRTHSSQTVIAQTRKILVEEL